MLTLVAPASALADVLADDELAAEDDFEDDDAVEDLSPDEQPDRPAITIAVPPTATNNPSFTIVLLLS